MSNTKIIRRSILKLFPLISIIGGRALANDVYNSKSVSEIKDFSFLSGEWKIKNKRRKSMPSGEWESFDGAATITPILDNYGSIEELRIPPNKPLGLGIRLFEKDKKMWSDHWVSAQNNVINPPMYGSFINNEALFTGEDLDGDKPIIVKSVWDKITPNTCRWWQAISYDKGKTWVENWIMDWSRV